MLLVSSPLERPPNGSGRLDIKSLSCADAAQAAERPNSLKLS
jgi:hypothetical protein